MVHTVIVPGVGGSEQHHWQSWLQRQLQSCSRVEQADWHRPVLSEWVEQLAKHVRSIHGAVQLVAHSFGCLTSLAALKEHPDLTHKIKHLTLVAPANPARFGDAGFARDSTNNYLAYFESLRPIVRTQLLMSENDPWLHVQDAQHLAHCWKLKAVSLATLVISMWLRVSVLFQKYLTTFSQKNSVLDLYVRVTAIDFWLCTVNQCWD